jgi:hypothetical protein
MTGFRLKKVVLLVYTGFLSKLRAYDCGDVLRCAAECSKCGSTRDSGDTGGGDTSGSGGGTGIGAQDRNYDSVRTWSAASV